MTPVMWLEFRAASLLKYRAKLLMFLGDMDLRKSPLSFQVSRHSPSSCAYRVMCSGVWLPQIGLVQKKALDLVIIERLTPLTEALQGCQVLLALSLEYGSKLSAPPLGPRCLHSLNGSHCFTVFQACEGIIVNALFAKFE